MRLYCGPQRGTSNPVSCDIALLSAVVERIFKFAVDFRSHFVHILFAFSSYLFFNFHFHWTCPDLLKVVSREPLSVSIRQMKTKFVLEPFADFLEFGTGRANIEAQKWGWANSAGSGQTEQTISSYAVKNWAKSKTRRKLAKTKLGLNKHQPIERH